MVRNLKFHEKKLLKKVDFIDWKSDNNLQEIKVMRRYHIQKRDDYIKYNKICGQIRKLCNKLSLLDPRDPYRNQMSESLLDKLYNMGIIGTKRTLSQANKVTVSAFCRRRLAIVMVARLKMAETVREAVTFIEQGHVRVGPEVVTDPAYLVTRNFEDFVTWVDTSKIKRKILKYNDKLDDFDLL
ncbi:putative IMP3-component of the U3 small nucleolar ribonucleo protein [Piromyces finnis]|uniref:U3 small nucleolar ribonucleoprotein protein IMP3 n=1 Tax=Piromyces finnis TaxID=1754191 RepID=A0A1Y1UR30_9FUNG|nr:putative IMP3-component of the U3 small nucleolar ribonucleo protein [Piromyces finnis]|eukprot:ORX40412.1 putative IMP3-component of the U3 small nucleolar ribonucleo protein [Piromyces finnis]